MRQTALQFKPKSSSNDENMRPLDGKAKRKRMTEDMKSPSKTAKAPAAGSSGGALHKQQPGGAVASDTTLGPWKPSKRVPVDSSDESDWEGVPFEAPKNAAKKGEAGADAWAGFGPPPPRTAPTGSSPAARPVQPSPPARAPAARSPGKSKGSSGKARKNAKKMPQGRPAAPPALPPTVTISNVLEGEAAAALVSSWQFIRCFAHVLPLEGCRPPSLEQLEQGLRSQGEVGAVSQLHVCLLKLILDSEDAALLDYESEKEEKEPNPAEGPPPGAPPAGADAPPAKPKRGRPPGNGARPLAAVAQPARRAQHVPRPNTGLHAWNAGDLRAYVDEATWPEVLRQLIVQWHLRVDDKDAGSRSDRAEPDTVLLDLAERLREDDYSAVPPPLRAAALGLLCEQALELLAPHIVGACEQLEAVRKAESSQDRAAKKAEREARHGGKAAMAAARAASSDAWSAYSLAEEELDRASQEYHKSAMTQDGVARAKLAMQEAQRARDEAREASKQAKEAIRRLQAGGAAPTKGESEADEAGRKPTDRLLSMHEAKAQAEARAAAAEAAARAAKLAAEREQWKEMVRLRPLGRDADGALYWQLPRPQPPDDLEYCQPPSAPVLLVETRAGRWGRVSSVRALRRSLAARNLAAEARLREWLAEAGIDDHNAEQEAGLLTPGGTGAHEWIGRRVRRVVKGEAFGAVVSGWRPARGDGRPAEWYLLYDDGDEEEVDEDDVRASLQEATQPELRQLRRKLIQLEAALLGGHKKSRKAGKQAGTRDGAAADTARAAWAAGVDRATNVDEMRALLEELYGSARQLGLAAGGADLGEGASRDAEWAEAWQREVEVDWHKRARASRSYAQLSLRADEAEWNLHAQGDLGAGTQLEVRSNGGKDGAGSGWRTAHVVAVFGDGSFRVVWEESGGRYRTKDVAAALSKAGQKEHGTVWRFRPAPRVHRNRLQAAAGGSRLRDARPQRSCTRQGRGAPDLAQAAADDSGDTGYSSGESDFSDASADVRSVDVGDVVEAVHGASSSSGSRRRWVLARVTRTMRGGAFEAAFVDRQFRAEEKLKLNENGRNKLWRWPDAEE